MVLGLGCVGGPRADNVLISWPGKLFTDEIEAIGMGRVGAWVLGCRPTTGVPVWRRPAGAGRFAGITIYTWDVAFRAATVVGFFGGGGMGLCLKRTVQSLETQRVAAILLTIIALVTVAELGSGWLRSRVRDWR